MTIRKLIFSFLAVFILLIQTDHCYAQEKIRSALLEGVNKLRADGCKCGDKNMPAVPKVKWNDKLEKAAALHANDMLNKSYFSHIGFDKSEPGDRATQSGYKWSAIGENIAKGHKTVGDVIIGWIKSPAHCRNMMDPEFTEIGATRKDPYWVLIFGDSL